MTDLKTWPKDGNELTIRLKHYWSHVASVVSDCWRCGKPTASDCGLCISCLVDRRGQREDS